MLPAEIEKRTETETSRHSSRSARIKREPSPSAKERKTKAAKSVKLQEPHKRKEKLVTTEEEEEAKDAQIISSSTVVNVDSVRERIKEEREELLALLETEGPGEGLKKKYLGVCELLLIVLVLSVVILFLPISVWFCVKIVREHERAVKFRLGHLLKKRPRGPGLMFYLPFLDVCHIVDIRLQILKIPPHMVVTKDLVCTEVTAVCYYRIENVSVCYSSFASIPDVMQALTQVSVREILAHHAFNDILLDRKRIAQEIQVTLDSGTCRWGIKVEKAEIEEINLPPELQHNFAVEAEARRQAQVKVIAAEGEKAACEALKASVESVSGSPLVMHLRLLQLLHSLRSEQPAVVLNIPPDVLTQSIDLASLTRPANQSMTTCHGSDDGTKDSPMM
ncbi:podocin isoform X1 [Danio rerio]|uniref:Podocin n=1 Tax=Danio rerio TaxID=7955 RepID=A4FVJ0_DANRE|nr:podocin [Danio rerio]XP_009294525.1 podocin isoform X1 [Danio rerio]AAI33977.1 Nphs2 protein [Danio rerio]|eukprot:NP_001018155.2 podocin [Danio rerio]